MTKVPANNSLNVPRLVRFISELAVTDVEMSHKNFAERLGQLIDLSDSIDLASAHGKLSTLEFEQTSISKGAVTEQFLQARSAIVRSVTRSFVPGAGPTRIKLPMPDTNLPTDKATAYQPYLKFYTAQQRDIDARVQKAQSQVRTAASGLSPELAQLAALDSVLSKTLAAHTRKYLAIIPQLLARRFEHLLSDQQLEESSWITTLEQFCSEMQGLLLAEIETRLLPVLGLVEALNTDVDKYTYE